MRPLVTIGSDADDRLRLEQLLGRAPTDGYLLRSPSTLTPVPRDSVARLRWEVIAPEVTTVWNSDIPSSGNDGAVWAGRGATLQVMGGVRARYGPVSLTLAPQLLYHQNRDFRFVENFSDERSRFAARWHFYPLPISIDLPTRFGDDPFFTFDLGQSRLAVEAGPVVLGAATDNLWWGPGIRNAIVMSDNAPGIPRVFVRTSSPLVTGWGAFEAEWIAGTLEESPYFDARPGNDQRTISGLVATFRPAAEPDLTLGFARTAMTEMDGMADRMASPFNVIGKTNGEQILSLFARWIFPADGLEVYGEWARHELAESVRDFLIAPHHTQGYTLGLQWAEPLRADSAGILRLQTEIAYLEQSATTRNRPTGSYYTSKSVVQGYTQRGQVIGAAIGPGASSQWIAADYLAPRWRVGAFAGRVRWDNDAYYLTQEPFPLDHDVSVLAGLRGGYRFPWAGVEAEMTTAKRLNFMFQNDATDFGEPSEWDVWNHTLRLTVVPVL